MNSATLNRNILMLLAIAVLSTTLVLSNSETALAHMSFKFVPGNGMITGSGCSSLPCAAPTLGNHTVSLVMGETFEPVFSDEYHDIELTLTHDLSSFGLGNAHKDQTASAFKQSDFSGSGKVFLVDAYFYPASHLVNSNGQLVGGAANGGITAGVKASATTNTDANSVGFSCGNGGTISNGLLTGNAYNCKPNAGGTYGYTDKHENMFMRPLAASEGMSKDGQYRQSTRQFYTEQGLTLYHIYGSINYFNDTGIGLTKINLWTDGGKMVKTLSMAAADGSGNRTYTVGSSFGMGNKTTTYWPGANAGVTEATHPSNLRKAIGSIQDNTFDIWNVLEKISNAINSIPGLGTLVPDYVPRNSTNSNAPTSYTFP